MKLQTLARVLPLLISLWQALPAAAKPCIPDVFPPRWLAAQEKEGGHTLARHVGVSDAALVERLLRDRRSKAASSFVSEAVAESAITQALRGGAALTNRWAAHALPGATRADDFGPADNPLGRQAERPAGLANVHDSRRFRTVIRATGGGGCLLLTAYPI